MNPILTTGTVTMTRNVGTHWLITLALAATAAGESGAVELPAGNEITLSAQAGSAIPAQGSTLSLRIEPRSQFAAPSGGAEAGEAAAAELKRHFAESLDETRSFYEKELAGLKDLLGDKDRQLAETFVEMGNLRAELAAALWERSLIIASTPIPLPGRVEGSPPPDERPATIHPSKADEPTYLSPDTLEDPPSTGAGTAPLQPAAETPCSTTPAPADEPEAEPLAPSPAN